MFSFNGFDHINMNVSNIEKSIKFYHDTFGFEVKEQGDWNGVPYKIIGISSKGYLALYEKNDLEPTGRVGHFGVHINNFDTALEKIKEMGIEHVYYEYPNSRSVYIEDPDGNEIELSSQFGGGL